jgi:cobalt-zinc-cadmium efflux system protein
VAHHDEPVSTAQAESRRIVRLWWALALTGVFLLSEVAASFITGSLALLSDAAHMLTDAAALGLAIAAVHLGRRPADSKRTFGYKRFEVLAATVNSGALFGAGIYILVEAVRRFSNPTPVASGGMLVVAVIGLIVNLVALLLLRGEHEHNLNVHGAYLEALSDLLGSAGVIVAGILIRVTGWRLIDPVTAILIALWVFPRTWRLLSRSINVLLEGVPDDVELQKLRDDLARIPGVARVHDLHVWAITSGQSSLSVHLVLPIRESPSDLSLVARAQEVARQHGIRHSTVQIEPEEHPEGEQHP